MSIATRLSLFVLIYVGLVLLGFSVSLYGVTRALLLSKVDQQLESGMHALVAAVEVHPDDVEWEPRERRLPLDADADLSHLCWTLRDEHSTLIDASADAAGAILAPPTNDPDWRLLSKRLRAGKFEPEPVTANSAFDPAESLPADRSAVRQSFTITVGVNQQPATAALRSLALAMFGVSLAIWLIAGLLGRVISRRMLRPVLTMAAEVRSLRADPEHGAALQVPDTRDEVADLGRAYNELLTSLRSALDQQRRFAGDASHQLRTPLAAILAAVDVTLRHERTTDEYLNALHVVQRRGRELQQIVEALLLLARSEPNAALPGSERIAAEEWCRTRLETWRTRDRFADFRPEWFATGAVLDTQPVLLGQVFDNLLDNACKYSPPGSPIVIRTECFANEVRFTIADRGSGIPAADLTRIFEPFFRASVATWKGISGSGLGLTIARRIATVLGGRLEAQSETGVGSVFVLCLPAVPTVPMSEAVTVDLAQEAARL